MTYVVLKKPFGEWSWQKVDFVDSIDGHNRAIANASFQRGDLFTRVPLDYVSDIEKHANWVGVATSSKRVKIPPRDPLLDEYCFTWFEAYQTLGLQGLMFLLPKFTEQKTLIKLFYLCTRAAVLEASLDRSFNEDPGFDPGGFYGDDFKPRDFIALAIQVIDAALWSNTKNSRLKAISDKALDHNLESVQHSHLYAWVIHVVTPLLKTVSVSDVFQGVESGIEVLNILPREARDEFANRCRAYVPLPILLLSLVEKKSIPDRLLTRP